MVAILRGFLIEWVNIVVAYAFFLKLTIYYMGHGGRLWYLQHRYLNTRRDKEKKRQDKREKGKEKDTVGNTNLH